MLQKVNMNKRLIKTWVQQLLYGKGLISVPSY